MATHINHHHNFSENKQENMTNDTQAQTKSARETKTHDMPEAAEASPNGPLQPRHLPDEIMMQILGDALALPNGVHSGQHQNILHNRVNKFAVLGSEQITRIVPEAFYKYTKVVVKPQQAGDGFIWACPAVHQRSWVRELEIEPWMSDLWYGGIPDRLTPQLLWVQELAAGSIGFENLEVLRIACNVHRYTVYAGGFAPLGFKAELEAFCHGLQAIGPLAFKTKKIEIVVDGHVCPGAGCAVNNEFCHLHARLSALLLAM